MGGKHKVANRTKNNARPSSSGRSAELLGSSVSQFIGFPGLKDNAFSISLTTKDELEAALDPNIQLILKKISKKDATTKIKGLQELSEVIKDSESESLKALLPVWPRFYNVLATDVDNRVREAVHKSHQHLVLKVKRNIAPYLKQVMAPWFTSQYDTYPPAASAASQAFSDAFPPNKYKEAIMFCQDEILSYINENILNLSSQTSSVFKNLTPEEADAKFDRVLISCLQGYNLYLEQVPKEHLLKSIDANNSIVSNAKFWKLAKNNMPHIRAAWFKVLTVICQKAEILLEGKEKEVTNIVFTSLDDSDPTVLPHVWEATLMVMSTLQNWWTYVNVDKVFFPKLTKILKNGGQGNATVLYPNLLPLLSHLPPNVKENEPEFYKKFFDDLRSGLTQKSTLASRSETLAVATAFVECLQYLISNNYSDEVFCKTLIASQLMQMIRWCLIEDLSCFKSVCKQIAGLVQSWSRNYEKSKIFDRYMVFFFDKTDETFFDTLKDDVDFRNASDKTEHHVVAVTDKQLEFLHSLKYVPKPKKKSQVKFAEEETHSTKESSSSTESTVHCGEKYIENLNNLVFKLCEHYVEYINVHYCKNLFGNLYSLVSEFDTLSVFTRLIEKMKIAYQDVTFYNIYQDLLEKWYKTPEYSCKHVVDLIFLLFQYITDEEKKKILQSLIQYGAEDSLGWCISEALAHPHNTDPVVKNWLQNENVSDYLVTIVDKQITNTCPPELSVLLKLALTENDDGELWIQKDALDRIIEKLINVMNDYNSNVTAADICTSLAGYISALVYTENHLLNFGDSLLLALFELSCNPNVDNDVISEETMYETITAWQDSITILTGSLDIGESKNLTKKFAAIFETFFQSGCLEENYVNYLTKVLVNFLRAIHRSKPLALSEFLSIFLEQPFLKQWKREVHNLCKTSELINGNLCSPYEKIDSVSGDMEESHCAKYFAGIYLIISVVVSNLEDIEEEEFDDDDDEERKPAVIVLNVLDNCENFFAELLYEQEVCQTYLESFKNTKNFEKVLNYFVLMEQKIKSIFENIDHTFNTNLTTILKEKCLSEAWFWCKVVYTRHKNSEADVLSQIYSEFTKNATSKHKLGVIHLTKMFKDHLTYDSVQRGYDSLMDIINLNCLMHCEDIDVQIAEVWMSIEKIRNDDPEFFHRMNTNEKLNTIIETFRLYTSWVTHKFETFTQKQWDFGMLLMATWTSYFINLRQNYREYEIQSLVCAIVKLFVTTDRKVKTLREQNVNNSFINEWDDVLYESIHDDFAVMWMYLAEQLEDKHHIKFLPIIQNFGLVVESINQKHIFRINQTLPKWSKFLKRSCSLLTNPQPSLQIWGYKMLLVIVPGLVKIDSEAVDTNTPHKKGLIFEQFKEKLVELHDIVNTLLMGFKLGEDSCRVEPSTDSFIYTLAYLLLWDVLLTLCEQASTELRYQYADWLRNEDMLKNLLNNLFRLMPTEVLQYSEGKSKSVLEIFLKKPEIHVDETCDGDKIEVFVCWLYTSTLTQLPAIVRQWWTSLDAKITQIVEKVTSLYVSPNLINQELNEVMKFQSKFKNMVIKTVPATRELIAIYTVDEAQVDLLISLPTNYPLGGLEVQSNKQIGGSSYKQWLLQFKKCVLHQNGRIWDGLSLWNNNLDKKFDGVEECYICFSVLHPGTYQLPKLSCQTCKKKFHSACLYKWFRTSYKSSCPICRNLF